MLGEAVTTEIARKQDAQGFPENKVAAKKGGRIAGEAREKLEVETGEKVSTAENYLDEPSLWGCPVTFPLLINAAFPRLC
jgi:hypothetical protein